MKLYEILFYTFSTLSIIHCSQESNQNEDSKSSYHIEFEDRSPEGGYGYKVQVSGKNKYQEVWKKDKTSKPTGNPTATGTSDYSINSFVPSTNKYTPKVQLLNTQVENTFPQDSHSSNSAIITNSDNLFVQQNHQLSDPIYEPSKNSVSLQNHDLSQTSTLNNFAPVNQAFSGAQHDHISKPPSFNSLNGFNTYESSTSNYDAIKKLKNQPDLNSKINFLSQNSDNNNQEWHYTSKPKFVPSTQYKPELSLSSTNSIFPLNYDSVSQGWQHSPKPKFIPSTHYSSRPSVQIMTQQDMSNYFKGSENIDPQVYIESISGKIKHNHFINQFELNPQVNIHPQPDLSNFYQQNPQVIYQNSAHNSIIPQTEISTSSVQYYQPTSQSKDNIHNVPLAYTNQYATQIPTVASSQSASSEGISYSKESISHKPLIVDNSVQIPTIPSTKQEIRHSKGHKIYKSPAIKYVSQYKSVPLKQYISTQQFNYPENNIFTPSIPINQYNSQVSSFPSTQFTSDIYQNTYYKPSSQSRIPSGPITQYASAQGNTDIKNNIFYVPSSQFAASIPSAPITQFASSQYGSHPFNNIVYKPVTQYVSTVPSTKFSSQETVNYVPEQLKPSIQLPTDYSQYPTQFTQETSVSLQTESKENPQQQLYTTVPQPVSKNIVSYHYKQEFPAPTSQTNVAPQNINLPNNQYVSLNPYGPNTVPNSFNVMAGYGQHALTGLGNIGKGIPVSPYVVLENVEGGKINSQSQYSPQLNFGLGSQVADGQGLITANEYNNLASNGYTGGLQLANVYMRRSSEKQEKEKDKKQVADQKQTE